MADILTQLQTCLDQLATQFYATLCYLTTYHDNAPATPPDVPDTAPALAKISKTSSAPPVPASAPLSAQQQALGTGAGASAGAVSDPNVPPEPDSPQTFARRQRELARDLIIKEQQIEYLISVLPGIGSSEAEQENRIRELGKELRRVEGEKEEKARELRVLRRRLERMLEAVQVGIYGDRGRFTGNEK
ncbi:RNA polymerase II mediator complex subunit [Monascus purpureus]|uniref:Mediator of RNA polymerase II transcription subunit 21 n=1 Tax=Monascus purpureus TaxID=5098 RepID=A0A507QVV9_MONPU|nr:RNA polymerase II mediator complex subunit [Monascus purpureus]